MVGTRQGIVSSSPSPIQALWRELDVRYSEMLSARDHGEVAAAETLKGECHGLAVAISIIWCVAIQDVSKEAHARHQNRTRAVSSLVGKLVPDRV